MRTLTESLRRLYLLGRLTYGQISNLADNGKITWDELSYITKEDE